MTVSADGQYTFTPDRNFNGADQFSYSVSDGRATVIYRVFVTVAPVNDAPVGSDTAISLAEDDVFGRLPTASDADGDTITYGLAAAAGATARSRSTPMGPTAIPPTATSAGPMASATRSATARLPTSIA